jgi:hypothetical protein
MAVTLHIEELVLHGFDPRDRRAIADALRGELASRLAAATPRQPFVADQIDAGTFPIASLRDVRVIARAVARAVGREVRG